MKWGKNFRNHKRRWVGKTKGVTHNVDEFIVPKQKSTKISK